jgi:biopolymer transport protein ExbD
MAGGDVAQRAAKPQKGLRRPKRRLNIRIDMTPMVDIVMLLLIFYMVTTVFAMPQAMEINLPPPPEDDQEDLLEVKESNLITVRVDQEGYYWWNLKRVTSDNLPALLPTDPNTPDTVDYAFYPDTLRSLLKEQNQLNSQLNTLVLIHPDASYADMINILDEIDLLERSWNQYTADSLRMKVEDLPKEIKFSYRYAVGDWQDADGKKLKSAREALGMPPVEGGE